MKAISVNDAIRLTRTTPAPCISLYLAADSENATTDKLRIKLQRLLKSAELRLVKKYGSRLAELMLSPLRKSLAFLPLKITRGGIGIYHSQQFTGMVRLPHLHSDLAVAANSFHLKPVIRCSNIGRKYLIVAFKKRNAELISVTDGECKVLERFAYKYRGDRTNQEVQQNIRSITLDRFRLYRKQEQQSHAEMAIEKFASHWHGTQTPIVLAGPQALQHAFRGKCAHKHVLEKGIKGSIQHLDRFAIASLSSPIAEKYFSANDDKALVELRKAMVSNYGLIEIESISKAAVRGQIKQLIIAEDMHFWGKVDRVTGELTLVGVDSEDTVDDVLDDLAEMTLNSGGQVTVVPASKIPFGAVAGAVLRWRDEPESNVELETFPSRDNQTYARQNYGIIA